MFKEGFSELVIMKRSYLEKNLELAAFRQRKRKCKVTKERTSMVCSMNRIRMGVPGA